MGKFVCLDFSVTVNGVDLSDHIDKVTINATGDEVESTAMGDTWKERMVGLLDWSANIEFQQDFAASKVDATLWAAFIAKAPIAIVAKPTSGSVSATNPSYTGSIILSQYSPLDAGVGDLTKTSITWPGTGALVRATS